MSTTSTRIMSDLERLAVDLLRGCFTANQSHREIIQKLVNDPDFCDMEALDDLGPESDLFTGWERAWHAMFDRYTSAETRYHARAAGNLAWHVGLYRSDPWNHDPANLPAPVRAQHAADSLRNALHWYFVETYRIARDREELEDEQREYAAAADALNR